MQISILQDSILRSILNCRRYQSISTLCHNLPSPVLNFEYSSIIQQSATSHSVALRSRDCWESRTSHLAFSPPCPPLQQPSSRCNWPILNDTKNISSPTHLLSTIKPVSSFLNKFLPVAHGYIGLRFHQSVPVLCTLPYGILKMNEHSRLQQKLHETRSPHMYDCRFCVSSCGETQPQTNTTLSSSQLDRHALESTCSGLFARFES